MLSRSNSNAADRLRRAKSISSSNASGPGQQRLTAAYDCITSRQHAETAAHEAYIRAHPAGPRAEITRPRRRRSQVTGRSEGSHLEDARLGRRRSHTTRDDSKKQAQTNPAHHTGATWAVNEHGDGTVTHRRRTVIEPSAVTRPIGYQYVDSTPSVRPSRRPTTVGGNSSPKSRTVPVYGEQQSALRLDHHDHDPLDEHAGLRYAEQSPSRSMTWRGDPLDATTSPMRSVRETQTDEEILALARDRCLQDFHHKDVRKRKSFIMGSLSKLQRHQRYVEPPVITLDQSVPPFNYADDFISGFGASQDIPHATATFPQSSDSKPGTEGYNFSGSMKGRLKRLLRKASRIPSSLPPQQVEAKHLHHTFDEGLSSHAKVTEILRKSSGCTTPGLPTESQALADMQNSGVSSRLGLRPESAARSRVTSWANSTVVGSASTRTDVNHLSAVDEHGVLRRSSSNSTLKKKGSFFGRAIPERLRRTSRAELRSSDESMALYSALQERIRPVEGQADSSHVTSDSQISEATSAIDNLPSRKHLPPPPPPPPPPPERSMLRRSAKGIRAVTPDSEAYGPMSPVIEVHSPQSMHGVVDDMNATPTRVANHAYPQQDPAQTAADGQAILDRRHARSRNRWHEILDNAGSSDPDTEARACTFDQDRRSMAQNPVAIDNTRGHPHAEIDCYKRHSAMLSPSIYSRATDGASPRSPSPEDCGGTIITITGREVKSYSISPPKNRQPSDRHGVQASAEWRKWLSEEMYGFADDPATKDLTFAHNDKVKTTPNDAVTDDCRSGQDQATKASQSIESTTVQRPTTNSRKSSFMNDRYPIIDTSRNSSRQSMRTSRKYSYTSSQSTRLAGSNEPSSSDETKDSGKAVSKRISKARIHEAMQSNSEDASPVPAAVAGDLKISRKTATKNKDSKISAVVARGERLDKTRSAFELRATYRTGASTTARPLEVRRKATCNTNLVYEDNTLQDISTGPYASTTNPSESNKENTPRRGNGDTALTALSSSEWLAGPAGKKIATTQPHPHSPAGQPSVRRTTYACKEGSPGQRMVTGWLDRKRSKEADDSLAFV